MTDSQRPVFNDRYELEQRIGRGGMADVYLARDRLLDRPVAIKVLFPEFATDPNFVERFRREAQSAANLNHPNVVSVYDWGKQGNTYFMAMEYIAGRTLADILRANGRLSAHQAAEIASEVASALGFAHRGGVVHRDVKPANILIADDGRVKVADFGIARALNSAAEQDLTQAGAVMGTATYFSPEQAQGAQPDPRSDLYSLGIVLYEMVGGRPPFSGDNPVAIAYKQVHDAPQPLNQLAPDVPRPFEAIVAKLLAKNPGVRYSNADELRDDLRRFREGQPVQALTALLGGAATATPPSGMGNPTTSMGATTGVPRTTAMPSTQGPGSTTAMPRTTVNPGTPPPMRGGPKATKPDYYEPPRRTGLYVLAGFLAIAALVAGGILLFNYLSKDEVPPAAVTVPDVRGLSVQEASTLLIEAGATPNPVPDPNSASGVDIVDKQDPVPGSVVTQGLIVNITFKPGLVATPLPELTGQKFELASQALAALGIAPLREDVESPEFAAGIVVGQTPPVGTPVKPGDTVTLQVSKGKGQETIPVFTNQTGSDAKAFLENKGFKVTLVDEVNETVAAGVVIRTEPPANTAADKGSEVKIFVSSGSQQVDVPSVIGLRENEARDAIQNADLKASVKYVAVPFGDQNDGLVISQTPASPGKAPKNSAVSLSIGKAGPPPATTTTTTTTTIPPTTASTTTTSSTTTTTTTASTVASSSTTTPGGAGGAGGAGGVSTTKP